MAAAVAVAVAAPAYAEPWRLDDAWRTPVRLPFTEAVAADLDGDGRSEIVAVLDARTTLESAGLAVMSHDSARGWHIDDVLWSGIHLHSLLRIARAGGDLVAVLRAPIALFPTIPAATIELYGGRPLQRVSFRDRAPWNWPVAAADVDGDGDPDLVEAVQDHPTQPFGVQIRDLNSDALVRTIDLSVLTPVAFAQLDGDAALELVSARDGVFDGVSGVREGTFSIDATHVLPGPFAGPTSSAFALIQPERIDYLGSTPPYAPLAGVSVPCCVRAATQANLDADAEPELLIGEDLQLRVHDRVAGFVRTIANPTMTPDALEVAQLDDDPAAEVLIAGVSTGLGRQVAVIDTATEARELVHFAGGSGTYAFVHGDLGGQGEQEIALVDHAQGSDHPLRWHVYDAADGTLKRSSAALLVGVRPTPRGVLAFDADDDAAQEIVFGSLADGRTGLVALDAASMTLQALSIDGDAAPTAVEVFAAAAAVDVDGDGRPEVAAVYPTTPLRLHLFDGETGALDATSPVLNAEIGSSAQTSLHVMQADADSALEIFVWDRDRMHVIDGATRQVQGTVVTPQSGAWPVVHATGGGCRITLILAHPPTPLPTTSIDDYDCDGTLRLQRHRGQSIQGLSFAADGPALGIGDGNVYVIDPFDFSTTSVLVTDAGPSAGLQATGVIRVGDGGNPRLLLGNDGELRAYAIVTERLWRDGFETE